MSEKVAVGIVHGHTSMRWVEDLRKKVPLTRFFKHDERVVVITEKRYNELVEKAALYDGLCK